MKSKNKIWWFVCIFIVTIAILLIAYYSINRDNLNNGVAAQARENEYIIGVYEEKIAVFCQDDRLPIEIYDVYVSTLPIKDQKELKNGIKVSGKVQLKQKIEDYTS